MFSNVHSQVLAERVGFVTLSAGIGFLSAMLPLVDFEIFFGLESLRTIAHCTGKTVGVLVLKIKKSMVEKSENRTFLRSAFGTP